MAMAGFVVAPDAGLFGVVIHVLLPADMEHGNAYSYPGAGFVVAPDAGPADDYACKFTSDDGCASLLSLPGMPFDLPRRL